MPGVPDPLYVLARRVLLDALEALGAQRTAVILVGAQAIYIHTGDADIAVAAMTTDGDLAIDPRELTGDPTLVEAMAGGGFVANPTEVGSWTKSVDQEGRPISVAVDLMVPEAIAGSAGRRAARLGVHGDRTARKARGLEAALVDCELATLTALDEGDGRSFGVRIAGPGALLVAKLHKIHERLAVPRRLENKDALDVLRLLRGVPIRRTVYALGLLLGDPVAEAVTAEAVGFLAQLFSAPSGEGSRMAAAAAAGLVDEATITQSCAVLAEELLAGVASRPV